MRKLNNLLLIVMTTAFAGSIASCKKDNLSNGGKPKIDYVRVTNPTSSDSLLIGAQQGAMIAIMGENLGGAKEMWFNDQKASLIPTFVTDRSILVNVPSQIPTEISNKIKIYFADGDSLLYDFEVQISKPTINSMVCEYVNTGDVATIQGDYFYEPVTVTFAGGVAGEIVSVTDQTLKVRVPEGAEPGQITVTTNFGETKSNFWFRDNRNIFIGSDPFEGWHEASLVVSNPGPDEPAKINGNYIHVKGMLGAWSYNEIADGPADAMPDYSKKIPDDAILHPEDYNLKFEVNTIKPYNSSQIRINAGTSQQDNGAYIWNPPYDTKGQWQTVVIPYDEVVASYAVKPTVNPNGYWTMLLIQGPGDFDADICFDNFRIVPKVIK